MIILISGANVFACQERLQGLIAGAEDRLSLSQIDISEPEAMDRLKAEIQGGSLFSAEGMIVLKYLEGEKSLHDQVLGLLADVPDSTKLIIYSPGLKKSSALYKKIDKSADETYHHEPLDPYKLSKWAEDEVKKLGGEISSSDARHLVEWVGDNQLVISKEIEKLVTYNKHVTKKSIESVAVPTPTTTIFQMLDAMVHGKTKQALKFYQALREQRLEAQYIISMIAWQAHSLSLAVVSRGKDPGTFASQAGISPFVLKKAVVATRGMSVRDMMILNAQVLKVDEQLKTAPVDGERLVEQLVRRVAASKA